MCTSPSPHPGKASKEQWHPPVRMEPVAPVPWHLVPRTGCHYTEFFKSAPNDSGIEPGMLYGRFGAYWCAPRRRRTPGRPPKNSGTPLSGWNQWHRCHGTWCRGPGAIIQNFLKVLLMTPGSSQACSTDDLEHIGVHLAVAASLQGLLIEVAPNGTNGTRCHFLILALSRHIFLQVL